MIRPLEYCETPTHLTSSIETIDARILELLHLRKQYVAQRQRILGINETELVNLTISDEIQQQIETDQLLQK